MKKIVISLIMVISVMFNANAQLNISGVIEKEPEKLLTLQMSYSWLYNTSGGYEIWFRTDNKFDRYYTSLTLGEDVDSVLQTLKDLNTIMEKEVAIVTVKQSDGDLTLTYRCELGVKQIWIKQKGNAGQSWITKKQVERLIEYFSKNN